MDETELDVQASLLLQNENLRREVEDLKVLYGVVKENLELRSRLDGSASANDMLMEKSELRAGKRSTLQEHESLVDERMFKAGHIAPQYTSSLLKNKASRSPHPDMSSSLSCQAMKEPERLLGEIGFQLERRILSYIFYKQLRLYGFTVNNIKEKIVQVSTHPLTGQVDTAYRSELNKRYKDLMDRLITLGYNTALHPPFTEFIINTYGILKECPDTPTAQEQGYNDLDVLRCVMLEAAPSSLLKDLLVLFSCLCYLSQKDRMSLILW